MAISSTKIVSLAGLALAILVGSACSPKRIPPLTIADLMEDRVALDGVLLKCDQNPVKTRNNPDCLNARVAIERLAKDVDPAEEDRRRAAFEASREKLRLAQDKVRLEQEAKTKVDGYSLPLVPVQPPPVVETTPTPPLPTLPKR